MHTSPAVSWTPLSLLGHRLAANIAALASRDPLLAELLRTFSRAAEYHIQPESDRVLLGVSTEIGIRTLPQTLAPQAALDFTAKLYPSGQCDQPVLVVGEDLGWLWNYVYNLPCNAPAAPGHRPPLYFLIRDIERLWVILHVQDWTKMLADSRISLFIGPDAFEQFRRSLSTDLARPWPKVSARIDPALWPNGVTLDVVLSGAKLALAERLVLLNQQLVSSNTDSSEIVSRLTSGRTLNILGITSRYTTFLQHSMRDWLSGFERLGHRTRLMIESADHEVPNTVLTAQICAEFKPDLVVIIDHFRREIPGLPAEVPVAMWVQDALPNIFNRSAGAAQGPRDYSLGFARLKMVHEYGYPASRFMTAIVGLNDERFTPVKLSSSEQEKNACDVSFVSHASTPADVLVKTEIDRLNSPEATRLLSAIHDQLKAVYDAGGMVSESIEIRRIVDQALLDTRTGIPDEQMPALMEFFSQKVNNAFFRHQSLIWLAEMGVDLRLYGKGWEKHPKLYRFARGPAENSAQLPIIYRASRISIQASPHGAVHQRVLEGLAAGGFFLMRYCPGDVMEREFARILNWCRREHLHTDAALRARATPEIAKRIANVAEMLKHDPFQMDYSFLENLRSSEEEGYIRSAGMIWGDDYDAVSFRSADELRQKVQYFLSYPEERTRRADSMREPVIERFTYVATSRKLIEFIAQDLLSGEKRAAA